MTMAQIFNSPFLIGVLICLLLSLIGLILLAVFERKPKENENAKKEVEEIEKKEEELERLKENTASTKQTNLEALLEKMERDLEEKENDVSSFEQEQEEKAIISYQELVGNVKGTVEKKEERTIPIALEDIEEEVEPVKEKIELPESKKFQNTEFISPIYGRVENHIEYPKIPKFESKEKDTNIDDNYRHRFRSVLSTPEYEMETQSFIPKEEPISDVLEDDEPLYRGTYSRLEQRSQEKKIGELKEIGYNNDDFLKALKEFRKNLE